LSGAEQIFSEKETGFKVQRKPKPFQDVEKMKCIQSLKPTAIRSNFRKTENKFNV
jgi:hypothetical protein